MKLGFENKKQTTWAIVLGVIALLVCAYELLPLIGGSRSPDSSAQAASPVVPGPATPRPGTKGTGKPGTRSPAAAAAADSFEVLRFRQLAWRTEKNLPQEWG